MNAAAENTAPPIERQRFAFRRVLLVGILVACGLGVAAWWTTRDGSSGMILVYGQLPEFALIERSGRSLRRSDLRNLVWIADFIFTNCRQACPLISARMAQFQKLFRNDRKLRLVSFSIDPEHDSPATLNTYAKQFQADPQRWWFVTGDKEAVYALVRKGFRLAVAQVNEAQQTSQGAPLGYNDRLAQNRPGAAIEQIDAAIAWIRNPGSLFAALFAVPRAWAHHPPHDAQAASHQIAHSTRFVLVDGQARIRGYYHSNDDADVKRLISHARMLLR